jgi:hypothetical protein
VSVSFSADLSGVPMVAVSAALQRVALSGERTVSPVRSGFTLTGRSINAVRIRGRRNGIIYQNIADVIVAVFCKYTSCVTSCGTKSVVKCILNHAFFTHYSIAMSQFLIDIFYGL